MDPMFEHLMWVYSTLVQALAAVVAVGGAVLLFVNQGRQLEMERLVGFVSSVLPEIHLIAGDAQLVKERIAGWEKEIQDRVANSSTSPPDGHARHKYIPALKRYVEAPTPVRSVKWMAVSAAVSGIMLLVPEDWYCGPWSAYPFAIGALLFFGVGLCIVVHDMNKADVLVRGEQKEASS